MGFIDAIKVVIIKRMATNITVFIFLENPEKKKRYTMTKIKSQIIIFFEDNKNTKTTRVNNAN
jgi:hypothetical protein